MQMQPSKSMFNTLIQLAYFGGGNFDPMFLHCASRELTSGTGGMVKLSADLALKLRRSSSRRVAAADMV